MLRLLLLLLVLRVIILIWRSLSLSFRIDLHRWKMI